MRQLCTSSTRARTSTTGHITIFVKHVLGQHVGTCARHAVPQAHGVHDQRHQPRYGPASSCTTPLVPRTFQQKHGFENITRAAPFPCCSRQLRHAVCAVTSCCNETCRPRCSRGVCSWARLTPLLHEQQTRAPSALCMALTVRGVTCRAQQRRHAAAQER